MNKKRKPIADSFGKVVSQKELDPLGEINRTNKPINKLPGEIKAKRQPIKDKPRPKSNKPNVSTKTIKI